MLPVAVVGLGYIGLPTAAVLAGRGVRVIGVDTDDETVRMVNAGEVPFVEPDLRDTLHRAVSGGMLTAQTEMPAASVYVIAVPTPVSGDHGADLSHIHAVTAELAPKLSGGELIILESTSPPGTTESIAASVVALRPDLTDGQVLFAHCPERVLPGRIMIELVENDRIVGGLTPEAAERAASLYRVFCRGRIILTDARTAELAKLVENSYRDVNIAFANELSLVCERLGIDVWELIELANHHPRVNILQPGPGVGGHCIAVDPWFIVASAPEESRLVRTAREVNDSMPGHVAGRILVAIDATRAGSVAMLGLAYKKNIDDLRESPAVEVVDAVAAARPDVVLAVVEPHIEVLPDRLAAHPNVQLRSLEHALADAPVVGLLVDHDHFLSVAGDQLDEREVIDTRGLWISR